MDHQRDAAATPQAAKMHAACGVAAVSIHPSGFLAEQPTSYLAPAVMGAPDRPELGRDLARSFCRNDPAIARHFARVTFLADHRADLAKSTVPTLILQCSDDLIALIDGRLGIAYAFLTGKVKIDAPASDLMMMRGLF